MADQDTLPLMIELSEGERETGKTRRVSMSHRLRYYYYDWARSRWTRSRWARSRWARSRWTRSRLCCNCRGTSLYAKVPLRKSVTP